LPNKIKVSLFGKAKTKWILLLRWKGWIFLLDELKGLILWNIFAVILMTIGFRVSAMFSGWDIGISEFLEIAKVSVGVSLFLSPFVYMRLNQ